MHQHRGLAALVSLALLVACGGDDNGTSVKTLATVGGTQLGSRVTVLYDKLGVPHVRADSDLDAMYAVGYVQARARLWQMDLYRRTARGTLGEIIAVGARQDAYYRTIFTTAEPVKRQGQPDSWRIEDAIVEDLRTNRGQAGTDLLAAAQRYSDGVNRYIEDLKTGKNGATLDPQYGALGLTVDDLAPWTPQDSFAIGRLQTWNLSAGLEDELMAGQLAAAMGPGGAKPNLPLFADLMRHAQAVPSVILPPDAPKPPVSTGAQGAPATFDAGALTAFAPSLAGGANVVRRVEAQSLMHHAGEPAGSNNWSVNASKSASGLAMIANDPHLALMTPATFHLIHITTPTRDVTGVAFPGAPVVPIGHNGKVGWGVTVVGYDVTDLYTENLTGIGTQDVFAAQGGTPVQVAIDPEVIKVKNGTAQTLNVYVVPGHGPIVPGTMQVSGATATAVSLKWVGQAATQEVLAYENLNKATTLEEAFDSVKDFGVGAQNFNFASTDGRIAYYPHAFVPNRAGFTSAPWLPLPSDGHNEWNGYIADADLPQVPPSAQPAQGFIATANNDVTGILEDDDPLQGNGAWPYLQAYSDLGYRHARIVERLTEKPKLALDDMTSIQGDNVSLFAKKVAPWIVTQLQGRPGLSAQAQAAVALLAAWGDLGYTTPTGLAANTNDAGDASDANAVKASAASTVFHTWVTQFTIALLGDELAAYQPYGLTVDALPDQQVAKIISALADPATAPGGPLATGTSLCDDVTTTAVESCADAIATALQAAVDLGNRKLGTADPNAWRWGKLHKAKFANPLEALVGTKFSVGPLPNDGGLFTVDVANFSIGRDLANQTDWSFEQHSGPNVRFTAEMNPAGTRWRAVIPGGEDIRPSDPHFSDQIDAWLSNQPGDQPYSKAEVDRAAQAKLVFDP